jgi:hypothetical protein
MRQLRFARGSIGQEGIVERVGKALIEIDARR